MNGVFSISFIGHLLARVIFVGISIVPVALGWLFAPLHFQDGAAPLISVFDAEVFPIAIQVKRFSEDYQSASEEGLLKNAPLEEINNKAKVLRIMDGDTTIAAALRILGNDVAIGITNPPNPDMVMAIRLDNFSWSAIHLVYNLANELIKDELMSTLETDNYAVAFAGRHLILGSDPWLVADVAYRLGGDKLALSASSASSISGVTSATSVASPKQSANDELLTIQSRGVLGRFRLSGKENSDSEIDYDSDHKLISFALTRVGEEFHLRMRSVEGLGPQQKISEVFPIETLNSLLEQEAPSLKNGEVLAIDAMIDPEYLQLLADIQPATEDPIQQVDKDIIEKGILPYIDGRFSLRFMESPEIEEILPVPEIRGAIGTTDAKAMSNALEEHIGRLITLFREPGGNELWEAVRQDTYLHQLDSEYPGARIHLHPLFFHKLEPYWFYEPGTDRLEWGTHFSKGYFVEPTSIQAKRGNLSITNLHASWNLPSEEIEKLGELFLDKAGKHNWLPQETLADARESADLTEKTLKTFPSGRLAISVFSNMLHGESDQESAFYLDMHAVFRIRVGD